MTRFLQGMKGVAIVAMAMIAAFGTCMLLRHQNEPGRPRVAPPRHEIPVQATKAPRPPGRPLVCVVRDVDGRPVAGATLVAGEPSGEPNHRTGTTGSDGRCELTPAGDSARLEYVMAYKEGFAPAMPGGSRTSAIPSRSSSGSSRPYRSWASSRMARASRSQGRGCNSTRSYYGIGDQAIQLYVME